MASCKLPRTFARRHVNSWQTQVTNVGPKWQQEHKKQLSMQENNILDQIASDELPETPRKQSFWCSVCSGWRHYENTSGNYLQNRTSLLGMTAERPKHQTTPEVSRRPSSKGLGTLTEITKRLSISKIDGRTRWRSSGSGDLGNGSASKWQLTSRKSSHTILTS